MKPFKAQPTHIGNYRIYYITGNAGDFQVVKVPRALKRAEHKNAPAIIAGSGMVYGPGIEWEIRPGQMDMDFPDMPAAGEYRYVAGKQGIKMFCSTYLGPYLLKRKKIEEDTQFEISAGTVALFVYGTSAVADKVYSAPFVVDALLDKKIIVPRGLVRGLQLIAI